MDQRTDTEPTGSATVYGHTFVPSLNGLCDAVMYSATMHRNESCGVPASEHARRDPRYVVSDGAESATEYADRRIRETFGE